MALPAQVALAVTVEVDLRDSRSGHGRLRMASAAERTLRGAGRSHHPRRSLVLLRDLMTGGAGEGGVVGHALLTSDLTVTSPTLLGCGRRLRGMGRMAGDAGGGSVVSHRIDLWKARGPGRVESVAERATFPLPVDGRLRIKGGGGVIRRGSVANLAREAAVVGVGSPLFDVRMTERALLPPGVSLLVAGDGVQGHASVVSELSKGRGDQQSSRHEKGAPEDGEDHGKTDDLLGHEAHPLVWEARANWNRVDVTRHTPHRFCMMASSVPLAGA